MKKKVLIRIKEVPQKFVLAEYENKEIKFEHVSGEYLCEDLENVLEGYYSIMREDQAEWDMLISKIKNDDKLIEKIENAAEEKFTIEYRLVQ